ncbi:NAD-dependent protein deacylase-like [Planococcus citri]|uniref:NAD-dependent protein deacylase-like n=1 Tax=Planococcus citri TaxID=170843 RepID=UPI0031F89A5E
MIIPNGITFQGIIFLYIILISMVQIHCYNQSSIDDVKNLISNAKHILVLTGPAIIPELKYPNYRDDSYMWRDTISSDLATSDAFERTPDKVWEFYSYLRSLALPFEPNQVHHTLAALQQRFREESRQLTVVTQCEDDLHRQAGMQNVIDLNGCIFRTKCIRCGEKEYNRDDPICEALKGYQNAGLPHVISREDLPHCKRRGCHSLLGPDMVWYHSSLDKITYKNLVRVVNEADLFIVIGSPTDRGYARAYQPQFEDEDIPCIEFNPVESERSFTYTYSFIGPLNETVPKFLQHVAPTTTTPMENIDDMIINYKDDKDDYKHDEPDWLDDMETNISTE